MARITNKRFFKDGKVLLFQKANVQHSGWFVRLPKVIERGYSEHRITAVEEHEAAAEAVRMYEQRLAQPTLSKIKTVSTYTDLYQQWHAAEVVNKGKVRRKNIERHNELYLLRYWGKVALGNITTARCTDYWQYRLSFWTTGPGVAMIPNVKLFRARPSGSTLAAERGTFMQCLRWGQKQGLLTTLPNIELPYKKPRASDAARAAFTWEEFTYLRARLWEDIKSYEVLDTMNGHGKYMALSFMLLGFATGMRPNEMYELKWHMIRDTGDGEVRINVPPNTKTGARVVVPLEDAKPVLSRLRLLSRNCASTDHVFTTWMGKRPRDYIETIERYLSALDMRIGSEGKPRTAYSMRHSYITFQLLNGVDIRTVARNCGTSVGEIEKHYDHVMNEQASEALTRLNASITEPTDRIVELKNALNREGAA